MKNKKIAFLLYSSPHSHGNRIQVSICNELSHQGYNITCYSNEGNFDIIKDFVDFPTLPLEQAEGDIVIGCDMGAGYVCYKKFMEMKAQLKMWYFPCVTDEYEVLMKDKNVLKVAPSTHYQKVIRVMGDCSVEKILLPLDNKNFYPLNMLRNNLVLFYVKKAGWVAPLAIETAYQKNNKIVAGIFGWYNTIRDMSCPSLLINVNSRDKNIINYIYNMSQMYVCTDGEANTCTNGGTTESMMTRTPVICSDWEGFSDFVNSDTAFLVPCGGAPEAPGTDWMTRPHPNKVANAILELFDNKPLQDRITKNAYELVYSYGADRWVSEFQKLLERNV